MTKQSTVRWVRWCAQAGGLVAAMALSGCSTQVLGSMAAAAMAGTQTADSQERARQQADADRAEEAAAATAAMTPETERSYLQVVGEMQRKSLWYASLAHLDALEQRWGVSDTSRLLRADALRQIGQFQHSERLYRALQATGQAARAAHGLGLLAAAQGQYPAAVVQLETARKLAPTDAMLLNDLGYALLHTTQAREARLPLMQAAQLQPAQRRILSNMAVYLLLFGADQEAAQWMQQHQMDAGLRQQVFSLAQQLEPLQRPTESVPSPQGTAAGPTPEATAVAQQGAPS